MPKKLTRTILQNPGLAAFVEKSYFPLIPDFELKAAVSQNIIRPLFCLNAADPSFVISFKWIYNFWFWQNWFDDFWKPGFELKAYNGYFDTQGNELKHYIYVTTPSLDSTYARP